MRESSVLIRPFAQFALDQLKDLKATVVVENRFSTVALVKNKHRSQLKLDKLRGYLIGRTLPSANSLSYPELWSRLKPWMLKKGLLSVSLRGKRATAYVTDGREQEQKQGALFTQTAGML